MFLPGCFRNSLPILLIIFLNRFILNKTLISAQNDFFQSKSNVFNRFFILWHFGFCSFSVRWHSDAQSYCTWFLLFMTLLFWWLFVIQIGFVLLEWFPVLEQCWKIGDLFLDFGNFLVFLLDFFHENLFLRLKHLFSQWPLSLHFFLGI